MWSNKAASTQYHAVPLVLESVKVMTTETQKPSGSLAREEQRTAAPSKTDVRGHGTRHTIPQGYWSKGHTKDTRSIGSSLSGHWLDGSSGNLYLSKAKYDDRDGKNKPQTCNHDMTSVPCNCNHDVTSVPCNYYSLCPKKGTVMNVGKRGQR